VNTLIATLFSSFEIFWLNKMEIWVVRKSQRQIKKRQQQDRAVPFVEIYCEKLYRKKLFSLSFNFRHITFVYRYNQGNWFTRQTNFTHHYLISVQLSNFVKKGFDFSKPG